MKLFSFRNFRITAALILLAGVAIYTKQQRLTTQGWYEPLTLELIPINADQTEEIQRHIEQLQSKHFHAIERFLKTQGERYDLIVDEPVKTRLNAPLDAIPPLPPTADSTLFQVIGWSLKFRWWAYRHTSEDDSTDETAGVTPIRLFLLYHDPNKYTVLPHSVGIKEGLIGIVHLFASADQTPQNNVVITHEFFHTVGASDKYNAEGLPLYPDGFADPARDPLYPQSRAEIMGGRIPQSPTQASIPDSLRNCTVGEHTAREIGWIEMDI